MITLKHFDYTSAINAMICIAARHSQRADGARQHALDEIAASLNNVAAIIARHKLADLLDAAIPPVLPIPAGQPDEDDDPPPTEEIEPEDAPELYPDLHPRQAAIYRYIRTHSGCTPAQIAEALDMSLGNVGAQISAIRKGGITIIGSNTRPTHYHVP